MSSNLPKAVQLSLKMQRAMLLSGSIILAGLGLLFLVILPAQGQLKSTYERIEQLKHEIKIMEQDIAGTARQKKQTAAAQAGLADFSAAGVLEPLLGSYAMRGKFLLDPLAEECGFAIATARESRFIPLQVGDSIPEEPYGRLLVEVIGFGGYEQIVNFIKLAEEKLQLLTLAGLRIEAQQQKPEQHKATITFEWPAKAEVAKP